MKHTAILLTITLFLVSGAAAQTDTPADPGPVTPSITVPGLNTTVNNPLWIADVAYDNVAKTPGEAAEERAAEALAEAEKGNEDGVNRAVDALENSANRSNSDDFDSLNNAYQTLDRVQERIQERGGNAQGIDQAQQAIDNAQGRQPDMPTQENPDIGDRADAAMSKTAGLITR